MFATTIAMLVFSAALEPETYVTPQLGVSIGVQRSFFGAFTGGAIYVGRYIDLGSFIELGFQEGEGEPEPNTAYELDAKGNCHDKSNGQFAKKELCNEDPDIDAVFSLNVESTVSVQQFGFGGGVRLGDPFTGYGLIRYRTFPGAIRAGTYSARIGVNYLQGMVAIEF